MSTTTTTSGTIGTKKHEIKKRDNSNNQNYTVADSVLQTTGASNPSASSLSPSSTAPIDKTTHHSEATTDVVTTLSSNSMTEKTDPSANQRTLPALAYIFIGVLVMAIVALGLCWLISVLYSQWCDSEGLAAVKREQQNLAKIELPKRDPSDPDYNSITMTTNNNNTGASSPTSGSASSSSSSVPVVKNTGATVVQPPPPPLQPIVDTKQPPEPTAAIVSANYAAKNNSLMAGTTTNDDPNRVDDKRLSDSSINIETDLIDANYINVNNSDKVTASAAANKIRPMSIITTEAPTRAAVVSPTNPTVTDNKYNLTANQSVKQ
ncbi:uncharacterized protein LOC128966122 [Oppia nitens]|uniref:uncharacterized protein LOC128966122 n=1 Tax=Oppia nitens TaxID=1686743 RepID=UPI0023DCC0FD|nr:uncharacterized protein LOC128966122 [Oppia nitens]